MTSKHLWGTGLLGASLLGLAVIASAPPDAPLPPVPLAAGALQARDSVRDSLLVSDSIYQGWKWFHVYCFRCHGEDAVGGINPAAPDLRWVLHLTGKAVPRDSFEYVTLNGRLDKGMPAWKVMLDTSAVKQLYLYTKARSDGWLKPGRPHRESDLKQSQ
ncbi:MAG: c-type cytochrome [Gemmatimonadales bacterium]